MSYGVVTIKEQEVLKAFFREGHGQRKAKL
jgi:hypothetical protein